jgi:hypothetical protein
MKRMLSSARRPRALTIVVATAAVLAPFVTFVAPAAAFQGVAPPTPQTFVQCPTGAHVAPTGRKVTACIVGDAAQGTIDIGRLDTTFKGPGIVDGGVNLQESLNGTSNWAQALNGKSFTAPRQLLSVPVMVALGNPRGVTPPAQSQVYVVAQQVGPMLFGVIDGGLVTVVPLAFRLENPLLGQDCYVGSSADPVTLSLTTGTSGKLTGNAGTVVVGNKGHTIQTIGTEVVDNEFTVPEATGCGSGGVFDNDLDRTDRLPSPAGANKAILYGNFDIGTAHWVARHLGG